MATRHLSPLWTNGSLPTLQARLSRVQDRIMRLQERNFTPTKAAAADLKKALVESLNFEGRVKSSIKRRIKELEYDATVEAEPWC